MSIHTEGSKKKDIPIAMSMIDSSLSGLESQLAMLLDCLYGVIATHLEESEPDDDSEKLSAASNKVRHAEELICFRLRIDTVTNKITRLLNSMEI